MARVYLSSTYNDLIQAREAVYHALRRMGHDIVAMEDYVATDARPVDKCLADVRSCDIYVGLFAWRYGYMPPGEKRSITELEFREAVRVGKQCLLFLLHEEAPWSRTLMDRNSAQIEALRTEISQDYTVSFFRTIDELAALITAAIANLQFAATTVHLHRTHFLRSPWLGIEFWQDEARNPLLLAKPEVIKVPLKQTPFEMRFPSVVDGNSVMICGSYEEAIFQSIAEDIAIEDIPFFSLGTGMADTLYGAGELVLRDDAHNHLDWGGRLLPRPEGGGVVLFHSVRALNEQDGMPRRKDVYIVVYVHTPGNSVVRGGMFERFILSFY